MFVPTIRITSTGFLWPFRTSSLYGRLKHPASSTKLLNCKRGIVMQRSCSGRLKVSVSSQSPVCDLMLKSMLSTSTQCCGGTKSSKISLLERHDDYDVYEDGGCECDTDSVQVPLIYGKRRRYIPVIQRMDSVSGNSGTSTLGSFFGSGTMTPPITVCVEGNIGSGKTTFLKHFKKFPEVRVFDEPISKWRDCQGYNLLDLMYKDPRKWSLCFQSYVQLTMLDLHTKPIVQPIKMIERSIFSAQYCFVQNMLNEGLMEDAQYAVLSEWFDFTTKNLPINLDLIVYLRTDPEVAFKRIAQRGRSEENAIKMEYIQSVHKLHEDWLINNQKHLPCPVLTIDANLELADMAPNYQLCEEKMFQKQKATVAN